MQKIFEQARMVIRLGLLGHFASSQRVDKCSKAGRQRGGCSGLRGATMGPWDYKVVEIERTSRSWIGVDMAWMSMEFHECAWMIYGLTMYIRRSPKDNTI